MPSSTAGKTAIPSPPLLLARYCSAAMKTFFVILMRLTVLALLLRTVYLFCVKHDEDAAGWTILAALVVAMIPDPKRR